MELRNQLPRSHPLTAPVHPPERVTGPPELHHSKGRYLNAWLFNADTVDKGLQVLMTQGCQDASEDRLGKTVIFARNHKHAEFISERFDHHYPHLAGKAARVIDNQTPYAQSLIDEFSRPGSELRIAISVDMLDTGIDIPEIVNLVFFKPVRSRTKFRQMVGRGTRTCKDLFGPGKDKECFWIFDCCQNLEFFLGQGNREGAGVQPSLTARLFRARLALLDGLDQQRTPHSSAADDALQGYRQALAEWLRGHVAACPADNFLVRPHLQLVERFSRAEAWSQLTPEDHLALDAHQADLPSAQAEQQCDTDAEARRFDLLLYSLQLALLRQEPRFDRLAQKLKALAFQLEELANTPQVAPELELIRVLLTDEWRQDVTVLMLEEARRRLRALIGLVRTEAKEPLYTNFSDELTDIRELDAAALLSRDDFQQFRLRARDFLKAHEDHLTMQRLRRNQPLTSSDLEELQRFLIHHGIGSEQAISRATEACNGFGLFIRSLVGLDRNAAKELFADFLAEGTHTATQIRFINEIIDELTSRGVMDPARLYDPPFSDLAPMGPEGLFSDAEMANICHLLQLIQERTLAA